MVENELVTTVYIIRSFLLVRILYVLFFVPQKKKKAQAEWKMASPQQANDSQVRLLLPEIRQPVAKMGSMLSSAS